MIQRIQSLFLLLASLFNLAALFVPLWQAGPEETTYTVEGFAVTQPQESIAFFEHENTTTLVSHSGFVFLTVLASLWLLLVIFQYHKRLKQIRRVYVGMLLICLEILGLVWLTLELPATDAGPLWGALAPILALGLAWAASKYIQKDEELVRSVDRIR